MSWAAHELESYVILKHTKARISYLAVLAGCLLPDLFTKLWVYGINVGGHHYGAANPAKFHRGWPGAGFGHSLLFGVLVATVVLWRWKSPEWALGLLIGQWAHCLTDTMDTVGTMLFFPFTTQHYSGGMWAYAATAGRYGDAAAYYGSLGGVWDLLWLLIALASWRVFRKDYFETVVLPNDPRAWGWLRRRFRLQESTLLAMYRAYFFYGACRIFAWSLWAWINGMKWDLSWGGPHNRMFDGHLIEVVSSSHTARDMLVHGLYGGAGVALVTWLVWRYYWRPRMPAPDSASSAPAPERAPA